MKDFIGLEKMKTLSEHNREMKDPLMPFHRVRAGVTCNDPTCSTEMLFTDPSKVCLTSPRKMKVHCPECGQTDYFVVERAKINRRQLKAAFSAIFTSKD